MAILMGMSDAVKGQRFSIDGDENAIGRSINNAIIIDDPSVSGSHCRILKEGNCFTLEDTGSTNGTRLNGVEVQQCRLSPKDIVQVGNVELMFDGDDIEPEQTDEPPAETPHVEVATGRVGVPDTFRTASPFGSRYKKHGKLWIVALGVVSLVVLVLLVYFLVQMYH